jgi:steroid delta-isomerase-like uncharacterized protein
MTTEQNKKSVRRLFKEGMGEKKFEVFDELIAEKFINHGMPNAEPGPEGFKTIVSQFLEGFPDMNVEIYNIVAEDDMVATRGVMTGSHKGVFMGVPPTGRKIKIDYIDFWKLANGKCIENWVHMDFSGLMQQLGTLQAAF